MSVIQVEYGKCQASTPNAEEREPYGPLNIPANIESVHHQKNDANARREPYYRNKTRPFSDESQ